MKRLSYFSFIVTILFSLISLNLYASPTLKTETRTVQGQGDSLNLAISNALINGVAEVNGTYVNAINAVINEKAVATGYVTIGNQRYPVNANILSQDTISAIKAATSGVVVNYQLTKKEQKDNQYYVTLNMTFAQYKGIDQSQANAKKYSFAVLPFQLAPSAAEGPISPARSISLLNQSLVTDISQSGQFRMIDRNNADLGQYAKEVAILSSGNVNSLNKARLSQMIGADYLLVGTIDELTIKNEKQKFYGSDFDHYIASTTVNFRLVEMATMEILYADTVTVSIPEDQITKILQDPDNSLKTVEQQLINKASQTISQKVLNKTKS
ncbi:CsgG/HfaB family protein [Thiotrichales bacterium 19S3-7]|nr:CsgG/HfaB family protein [Thiotrichales bacterium 19S3-7]MCF6800998.1 CsgG/HfaB family protein [Thiotrichales bacterium 19S3-11]